MFDVFKGFGESYDPGFGKYSSAIYDRWVKDRTFPTSASVTDIETVSNGTGLTREKLEEMKKMMNDMQQRDPYESAEKAMNKQLQKKGLPDMDIILESFRENNPEYFI